MPVGSSGSGGLGWSYKFESQQMAYEDREVKEISRDR